MLFNSFPFLELVIITFAFYYTPFLSKLQVPILLVSSLAFYAYNQPILVLLLIVSVSIDIVTSYYIVYGNIKNKKAFAIAGVALNLFILLFFKYSPLFAKTFFNPTDSVGEFLLTMPLPLGISFFTFHGMGLVLDVYKGKYISNTKIVPKSFVDHARQILLFKGFFPQLISGPIIKAHSFIPQIGPKSLKNIQWEVIVKNLILGYFLKMVIADNLKEFTFWITFPFFQAKSSLTLLFLLFGYSFQIFADFAGYSLIAIGVAKLFGYNLPDNFNFPFISTSIKEFWQRWHITLTAWVTEYIFIPLSIYFRDYGNIGLILAILINFIIIGSWHGANWMFVLYGILHGIGFVIEMFLGKMIYKKIKNNKPVKIFNALLVFSFVTLAFLLFKLPDFAQVVLYIKCLHSNLGIQDESQLITYIILYSAPIIIYHLLYLLKDNLLITKLKRLNFVLYAIMLFLIIVNSGPVGAFIYFQF